MVGFEVIECGFKGSGLKMSLVVIVFFVLDVYSFNEVYICWGLFFKK